ncbi:uncharacterized protein LACBIDRAFT_332105 [Laccaria bicolor S238N-H82]|uniref:Predicted protein n=1 Tax=Laccaria bicolor (strain S238N-H82 / ATCC MYA-4686) TaxID=486041 RepID=B0DRL2_LACBS|nr:uncharacterized protein LACBIDRAFT_332105 [Laccaria bicolor S238N-H82]EDR02804.1 predicted protein [Laccaria bicolor S238N-H82]|eukprot:XP_001886514.1 predicted protein [Laccaria bicolor S238N-H82]
MGYNDDGNDDMSSPPPRVDDNENFEFDDPPSFPPPLPPRIVYLPSNQPVCLTTLTLPVMSYSIPATRLPPNRSTESLHTQRIRLKPAEVLAARGITSLVWAGNALSFVHSAHTGLGELQPIVEDIQRLWKTGKPAPFFSVDVNDQTRTLALGNFSPKIRFPTLPAFIDSLVTVPLEPPLGYFHSQLAGFMRGYLSYPWVLVTNWYLFLLIQKTALKVLVVPIQTCFGPSSLRMAGSLPTMRQKEHKELHVNSGDFMKKYAEAELTIRQLTLVASNKVAWQLGTESRFNYGYTKFTLFYSAQEEIGRYKPTDELRHARVYLGLGLIFDLFSLIGGGNIIITPVTNVEVTLSASSDKASSVHATSLATYTAPAPDFSSRGSNYGQNMQETANLFGTHQHIKASIMKTFGISTFVTLAVLVHQSSAAQCRCFGRENLETMMSSMVCCRQVMDANLTKGDGSVPWCEVVGERYSGAFKSCCDAREGNVSCM